MNTKKKIIILGLVSIFLITAVSSITVNAEKVNMLSNYPILKIDDISYNPDARQKISKSSTTNIGEIVSFDFELKNIGGGDLKIDINSNWYEKNKDGSLTYHTKGAYPIESGESINLQLEYELTDTKIQHKVQQFSIAITNEDDYIHAPQSGRYNQYIIEFTFNVNGAILSKIKDRSVNSLFELLQNRFPMVFSFLS